MLKFKSAFLRLWLLCLAFFIGLLISCRGHSDLIDWHIEQRNILSQDQEFQKAAQAGLNEYLALIPQNELSFYGFTDKSELERATLGTPIASLFLKRGVLDSSHVLWLIPIFCDSSARSILSVDKIEGRWQAVSIGSAEIAQRMSELYELMPDANLSPLVSTSLLTVDFLIVKDSAYSLFLGENKTSNQGVLFDELRKKKLTLHELDGLK